MGPGPLADLRGWPSSQLPTGLEPIWEGVFGQDQFGPKTMGSATSCARRSLGSSNLELGCSSDSLMD